jgi:hypothetical protein
MVVEHDGDESLVKLETESDKKGKTDNEYEVAPACIKGWFPKTAWGKLDQTWAGLGQLLNKKEERIKIAEFVDLQSMDWKLEAGRPPSDEPNPESLPKVIIIVNVNSKVNVSTSKSRRVEVMK